MILVILSVSLLIGTVCMLIERKRHFPWDDMTWSSVLAVVGYIVTIVALIATLVLGVKISRARVLPKQIEIYTQENQKIEAKVENTINAYLTHEGSTYADIKPDEGSAITAIAAFPELASSELVKSQIEVYTNNSKKIKELRNEELNIDLYKWWLYFGD